MLDEGNLNKKGRLWYRRPFNEVPSTELIMLKPTNIIVPIAVLGVTVIVLGLAAILYGGRVDIQLGQDTKIEVIGPSEKEAQ